MSCLRFNFKHLVAVTGEDFEAPSPTVELPQTLNDDVSITVGILDDNILEGDHSFTLCVMEVLDQSGLYTIRVEDSSGCDTVTITDEDDGKSTYTHTQNLNSVLLYGSKFPVGDDAIAFVFSKCHINLICCCTNFRIS